MLGPAAGLPGIARALEAADLPALRALLGRCLAADGGLPVADGEEHVRGSYLSGPGIGVFVPDGSLVAAAALGPVTAGQVRAAGAVDPSHRGRGLGQQLLEWAFAAAGDAPVTVASESVTEGAERLYARFGLEPVLAELVMRRDLALPAVAPPLPPGIVLSPWSEELAPLFFAAYDTSFRDRPGFPGWSRASWVEWTTGDDDFRPDLCLLALGQDGVPAGFLTAAANWIVQTGVVPGWRGRGLGITLVTTTLAAMRAAGFGDCWLTVATNNPAAAAVYRRCGFQVAGRRGRYAVRPDGP